MQGARSAGGKNGTLGFSVSCLSQQGSEITDRIG